jgi:hypothetical protein
MFFSPQSKDTKPPDKIVMSNQAFLSVTSEVSAYSGVETGGIFLGTIEDNTWYIIETIDPGYERIIREGGYFRYDVNYVNHLANIRNRFYANELVLLGLWHRHPGSMDSFSGTDRETNRKFAENSPVGSLSAIINIDPEFRITMYYISPKFHYSTIDCIIYGDKNIPSDYLQLKNPKIFLDKINKKSRGKPDKLQEKLMQIFENEYITFLSQQKEYAFEVEMEENSIKIELQSNNEEYKPDKFTVVFSYRKSDKNQIITRFIYETDSIIREYEYKPNIICKFIKAVRNKNSNQNKMKTGGGS